MDKCSRGVKAVLEVAVQQDQTEHPGAGENPVLGVGTCWVGGSVFMHVEQSQLRQANNNLSHCESSESESCSVVFNSLQPH